MSISTPQVKVEWTRASEQRRVGDGLGSDRTRALYNLGLSVVAPSLGVVLITVNPEDNQFTKKKKRWLGGSQFYTIHLMKLVYEKNTLSTSHILARTKTEKKEGISHILLREHTAQWPKDLPLRMLWPSNSSNLGTFGTHSRLKLWQFLLFLSAYELWISRSWVPSTDIITFYLSVLHKGNKHHTVNGLTNVS